MKSKRSLNYLGVWFTQEFIDLYDGSMKLANRIRSTSQNVFDFLRGHCLGASMLQRWRKPFENALGETDGMGTNDLAETVVFRAISTHVMIEGNMYTVYGIQMLSGTQGNYVIVDEIRDITIQVDTIFRMVELLNDKKVSAVHFRDVVMDSIV